MLRWRAEAAHYINVKQPLRKVNGVIDRGLLSSKNILHNLINRE